MSEAAKVTWGFWRAELCPRDEHKRHLIAFTIQASCDFAITYPPPIPPELIEWHHWCPPPPLTTRPERSGE